MPCGDCVTWGWDFAERSHSTMRITYPKYTLSEVCHAHRQDGIESLTFGGAVKVSATTVVVALAIEKTADNDVMSGFVASRIAEAAEYSASLGTCVMDYATRSIVHGESTAKSCHPWQTALCICAKKCTRLSGHQCWTMPSTVVLFHSLSTKKQPKYIVHYC